MAPTELSYVIASITSSTIETLTLTATATTVYASLAASHTIESQPRPKRRGAKRRQNPTIDSTSDMIQPRSQSLETPPTVFGTTSYSNVHQRRMHNLEHHGHPHNFARQPNNPLHISSRLLPRAGDETSTSYTQPDTQSELDVDDSAGSSGLLAPDEPVPQIPPILQAADASAPQHLTAILSSILVIIFIFVIVTYTALARRRAAARTVPSRFSIAITQAEKGRIEKARRFVPKGWRGEIRRGKGNSREKARRGVQRMAEAGAQLPIIVKEDVDSGKGRVIHAPGLVHSTRAQTIQSQTKSTVHREDSQRSSTPEDVNFVAAQLYSASTRTASAPDSVFLTDHRSELDTIAEVTEDEGEDEREYDLGDGAIADIFDERPTEDPFYDPSDSLDELDGHIVSDPSECAFPKDNPADALAFSRPYSVYSMTAGHLVAYDEAVYLQRKDSDASPMPEEIYESDEFSEEASIRSSVTSFGEGVSESEPENVTVVEMQGVRRVSMEYEKAKVVLALTSKEEQPPPLPSVLISSSPSSDADLAYMYRTYNSKSSRSFFDPEAEEYESVDIWQDELASSESDTSSMRTWASQRSLGVEPYDFPKPPVLLNSMRSTSSVFKMDIERSLRSVMGRMRGSGSSSEVNSPRS
ncbi:uncharacterized protein STEHIDRAFT_113823 [Stereum hirsutum FP-91666 SS1]|uniref:uncharacterized protein n=1 Tax=Stereum hirsutum (strain FP-91666) TaxID=721885 RepID=UPI0004449DB2|nr:uncharacterized protein STEHIDRAFT_113823 [Stereum hirsutum FP-91666 SS1]EIM82703.1 hypothetical protein STEHIDRAFT_113823 [Stereum hirsutum FP-91666 SS1]